MRFSQRCSVHLQADRVPVRLKPDTTYYDVVKNAVDAIFRVDCWRKLVDWNRGNRRVAPAGLVPYENVTMPVIAER